MSASFWPTMFVAEVCFWLLEKNPEIGGSSGMASMGARPGWPPFSRRLMALLRFSELFGCVFLCPSVYLCPFLSVFVSAGPGPVYSGPPWLLCQSVCAKMCCLLRSGLTPRLRGNDTISVGFFWFKRCFKLVLYSHGKSERSQSELSFGCLVIYFWSAL